MKDKAVKITLLFATIILVCSSQAIRAQYEDTGSVRLIVQQQIEEAKKKNNTAAAVEKPAPVKTEIKKIPKDKSSSVGISSAFVIKGLIMLAATAAALVWLKTRRAKRNINDKNSRFKKNIKLMREEKFIKEIDPKLKEIRTRLTLTSVVLNEESKVTAAARKSQIGKEEILLASRIRSHEMQYGGQRSFA
jgi:hypothetical protein